MTINIKKRQKTCKIGASDPVTVHIIRVIEAFSKFVDHTVQWLHIGESTLLHTAILVFEIYL